MSNTSEKLLEKILREVQDIKVILHEHCTDEELNLLKNHLCEKNTRDLRDKHC